MAFSKDIAKLYSLKVGIRGCEICSRNQKIMYRSRKSAVDNNEDKSTHAQVREGAAFVNREKYEFIGS